jgi:hypothetical protein
MFAIYLLNHFTGESKFQNSILAQKEESFKTHIKDSAPLLRNNYLNTSCKHDKNPFVHPRLIVRKSG